MTEIGLLQLVHLLGLVYWLGADLGVFYSSYYVADEKLSAETRLTVARILFALDQCPRIAMPLMLASGAHLAWRYGALPVTGSVVGLVWAACAGWLVMVLLLHAKGAAAQGLARFDFGFRSAVVALLAGYAVWGLVTASVVYWVAWKIAVFAGLVACGLVIRVKLKPCGPAFAALAAGSASDADNRTIRAVFAATRPFVLLIWAGLIVNTLLGLHLL